MDAEKGKLIVIEGGDASGKAVQTAELTRRLTADGIRVETMSFPRYDQTIGTLIGESLRGERGNLMNIDARIAATLFAADRFEAKPKILEWLDSGAVVILDRYTTASMLHQGAKIADEIERNETIQWIYHLEHTIFALPVPDAVVYLDVPAEVREMLQHKEQKEIDLAESDREHQRLIDERADHIFDVYKNTVKIECMRAGQLRSIEDIGEEVYNQVQQLTT